MSRKPWAVWIVLAWMAAVYAAYFATVKDTPQIQRVRRVFAARPR